VQPGSLSAPARFPGNTRDTPSPMTHNTAPVAPTKPSIWKREIKWPWGNKTASPTRRHTPKAGPAKASEPIQHAGQDEHTPAKSGNAASTASWDPRVLKAIEDSLAEHIGPVAKILVGRAAHHTKDLHTLCQALAAHLPTEQARQSFLHNALQQRQTRSGNP
jgi:serine/threonine-protein kinase